MLRNLCNPNGSCSHQCGQGECLGAVNASRRALWLRPLPAEPATDRAPRSWDYWLAAFIGGGLGLYCADWIARFFLLY